jgi:hypothetical protein
MTTSEFQAKLDEFRKLRESKRKTVARIQDLRTELAEIFEKYGEYIDEDGWVKEMEAKGRWQCKNPEFLAKQAQVWAESEDTTINTLGKTVMTFLVLPPDTTYIHVK